MRQFLKVTLCENYFFELKKSYHVKKIILKPILDKIEKIFSENDMHSYADRYAVSMNKV